MQGYHHQGLCDILQEQKGIHQWYHTQQHAPHPGQNKDGRTSVRDQRRSEQV